MLSGKGKGLKVSLKVPKQMHCVLVGLSLKRFYDVQAYKVSIVFQYIDI